MDYITVKRTLYDKDGSVIYMTTNKEIIYSSLAEYLVFKYINKATGIKSIKREQHYVYTKICVNWRDGKIDEYILSANDF